MITPEGDIVPVNDENPLPTSGGAGGGMQPDEITASAPATWDPETKTVGVTTGTTEGTVATGDHTHAASAITSGTLNIARIPTGTTSSTVATGNHTHTGLMTGSATAVADSTAEDVATLVTDLNALLAALRSRGVIS